MHMKARITWQLRPLLGPHKAKVIQALLILSPLRLASTNQVLRSNSALEKAGLMQPLLILSLFGGNPGNAGLCRISAKFLPPSGEM